MSPILASPPISKSTKSLHGDISSSWLVENLLQRQVLDCMKSPFTKITFIALSTPHLSEAVSQSYLRCCLPGCSPHFATNNSQLSHCAFFFFFKVDTRKPCIEIRNYNTWGPEEMQLLHESMGEGAQGPHILPSLPHFSIETFPIQLRQVFCGRHWGQG